jgi:hypothetical protein
MNTPYAITCPACRNEFPQVLNCDNCGAQGKLVICPPPEMNVNWVRIAAWLVILGLLGGAFWWGWSR